MATLTNNQMSAIVTQAYKEMTGMPLALDETLELNLQNIVDVGDASTDLATFKEQFTKALLVTVVKNWFTDSSYRSQYNDKWLIDEQQYGGIIQSITIEAPEVRESGAWMDWTSGESTITTSDTIFLPRLSVKLYGVANSFELPLAITDNQWRESFDSAAGLMSLISYIFTVVDNKLLVHLEACSSMNRNNFIATKIDYAAGDDAKGTHVVNPVEEYCKTFGIEAMSVAEFLKNADALRWASRRFGHYAKRMRKDSCSYNVEGKHRFTPSDRFVFEMNSDFVDIMDSVALANTFRDEYVSMPGFDEVPYWQTEEPGFNANGLPKSMEIFVKTAEGKSIDAKNVIGFMADKWAIRHVIVERRTAAQRYDRHAITQYYYQYKDKFENDLSMNAIVFVLADVTA